MINVSLIILCGLGVVALARRQSAALRHWVLAAAIGCAAASPVLERTLPAWDFDLPISTSALPDASPVDAAPGVQLEAGRSSGNLQERAGWTSAGVATWLRRAWLLGSILSLLGLLIGVGRLMWLSARATRCRDGSWSEQAAVLARDYGLRREIAILESHHPTLLVTWGWLHPRIMLPAGARDWPEARVRVVLSHELAHIKRGDWMAQLLAEALRSAFWFNPLVWIASRRLRLESEQACDDAVLRQGIGGPEYATHLLDLARAARRHRLRLFPGFPAPAMARPCSLERRVTAMLNTQLDRTPTTRPARLAIALGLAAFAVLACAIGVRAQNFATFSGTVFDPMNAGVPKVIVTLTNVQSEAKHEVRSDAGGRFEFVGLVAGEYRLEATYPGFMSLTARVTVSGQNIEKDLAMQIGTLRESITVMAGRGTAPAAPTVRKPASEPVVKPCSPAPGGGNIRPPMKVRDVKPMYPASSADAGVGGNVVLDARIGVDGYVNDVAIRESSSPDLAAAAVDSVRQWQFTPTLLNCTPVEVAMQVNVKFVPRN